MKLNSCAKLLFYYKSESGSDLTIVKRRDGCKIPIAGQMVCRCKARDLKRKVGNNG